MSRFAAGLIAVVLLLLQPLAAVAQEPAPAPPPADVQQLIDLLRKPDVQAWLEHGGAPPADAVTDAPAAETQSSNLARDFRLWVAGVRAHLLSIRDGTLLIPVELGQIGQALEVEIREQSVWRIVTLALGLLVLGYGIQRLFWAGTRSWRKHVIAMPLDTVAQRLTVVGLRLGYNLLWIVSFAFGSLGALLMFAWPPLLKSILSATFLIIIVALLWGVLARFLLSPHSARLRVFPISDASARHWSRWSAVLMSWFFGGWMVLLVLRDLDVDQPARLPIAYALGLVLFGLALVAIWGRPALSDPDPERRERARNATIAVSLLFAALWLLWVFSLLKAFWLVLIVVALPTAAGVVDRSVDHLLTPPGTTAAKGPPSVLAVALERGTRALLIIAAIWLLAWGWGIELDTLTASETMTTRLLRGLLNGIVILLVADFAWRVLRSLIDQRIHLAGTPQEIDDPDEISRRSRMRTLLPILRNILFIVVAVMAVLMALSAMGVQIAPLIAGAGVVGVAVGFGSQTLVKDVISGIFFLLDDAFRVGEYIVSGSYKGTVESFSLRSIKLRHQRGSIYTVPFGSLGAVQNMSRDWVIEKLSFNVPFDTDLDKMRKVVKQIGQELAADPALAPHILQPLKMQGVDAVGELGMQVRLKMMTKPGEQFVIRRKAYAMLKQAFAEHGIKLAFPTVQVAEGVSVPAAAAMASRVDRPTAA